MLAYFPRIAALAAFDSLSGDVIGRRLAKKVRRPQPCGFDASPRFTNA